ncbi:MAG: chitobiase/beta-hexosaminidase C-terminal domain-containing protein [Spirochaetales bacterium]|nr:chitobiase/beta-hexosaminidase C-terminal domain-containing protein [Spirochaetales bacterium]
MKKVRILILLFLVLQSQVAGQVRCIIAFIDQDNVPVSGLTARITAGKITGQGDITDGRVIVPLPFAGSYTGTITLVIQTNDRQPVGILALSSKAATSMNFSITYTISKTPVDMYLSGNGKVLPSREGMIPVKLAYSQQLPELKPPVFDPLPGTYSEFISVTIQNRTTGAQTYYTTDSSIPAPGTGILYTEPVTLTDACTIKAMSVCNGFKNSDVVTGTYDFFFGALPAPGISPAAGTYQSPRTITISSTVPGVELFYSLGDSFIKYAGPLVLTDSCTISAQAKKKYYGDSPLVQSQLTILKRDLSNTVIKNPVQGTPEWALWKLFALLDKNNFDEFRNLLCHEELCCNDNAITSLQKYNWVTMKNKIHYFLIDSTQYSFKIIRTNPPELTGIDEIIYIYVYAGEGRMPEPFKVKLTADGTYKLIQL